MSDAESSDATGLIPEVIGETPLWLWPVLIAGLAFVVTIIDLLWAMVIGADALTMPVTIKIIDVGPLAMGIPIPQTPGGVIATIPGAVAMFVLALRTVRGDPV